MIYIAAAILLSWAAAYAVARRIERVQARNKARRRVVRVVSAYLTPAGQGSHAYDTKQWVAACRRAHRQGRISGVESVQFLRELR